MVRARFLRLIKVRFSRCKISDFECKRNIAFYAVSLNNTPAEGGSTNCRMEPYGVVRNRTGPYETVRNRTDPGDTYAAVGRCSDPY